MLAFWKPRGLTRWRSRVRPGTSESRNREVAPQNRAPGKSRGRSKWGRRNLRNLTAPRALGELSPNPAPPSAKREPCGRRRLGPRLPRLDGKRQHTLPSRSSPRIPPGPCPDPPPEPRRARPPAAAGCANLTRRLVPATGGAVGRGRGPAAHPSDDQLLWAIPPLLRAPRSQRQLRLLLAQVASHRRRKPAKQLSERRDPRGERAKREAGQAPWTETDGRADQCGGRKSAPRGGAAPLGFAARALRFLQHRTFLGRGP